MTVSSGSTAAFANSPLTKVGPHSDRVGPTSLAIINRFKEMYAKPKETLAAWLGISESTAKRTLHGRRELTMEEFAALLRSDQGFEFLTVVMADARPRWWRICAPLMDLADIQVMQAAARKRMAKVLGDTVDADRDLSAAIARSEALAIHDAEHMRPHLDALRSMARVSDRPVAAPAAPKRR